MSCLQGMAPTNLPPAEESVQMNAISLTVLSTQEVLLFFSLRVITSPVPFLPCICECKLRTIELFNCPQMGETLLSLTANVLY